MEHRGSNRGKKKAIGLLELKRAIFQNIFSSDESQSA